MRVRHSIRCILFLALASSTGPDNLILGAASDTAEDALALRLRVLDGEDVNGLMQLPWQSDQNRFFTLGILARRVPWNTGEDSVLPPWISFNVGSGRIHGRAISTAAGESRFVVKRREAPDDYRSAASHVLASLVQAVESKPVDLDALRLSTHPEIAKAMGLLPPAGTEALFEDPAGFESRLEQIRLHWGERSASPVWVVVHLEEVLDWSAYMACQDSTRISETELVACRRQYERAAFWSILCDMASDQYCRELILSLSLARSLTQDAEESPAGAEILALSGPLHLPADAEPLSDPG